MTDTFYLQNQIQLELNNLERNHVYYSIDEQPEVCARLIAESYLTKFFPRKWSKSNQEIEADNPKGSAYDLGYKIGQQIGEMWTKASQVMAEEIFNHHVSVTVQSWDDVPAAIGLIRERQREFKKRNNL